MLRNLLSNHVLANLTFALVLVIGMLSYQMLPRQQDPTINFNWIVVTTILPGASASDVEKRVTDPLEDAIRDIRDIDFVSSNSRENISSLLVRFEDIDERTFDRRVTELRREIQNKRKELPEAAEDSLILEITSGNAFPAATVAVTGLAKDETLRIQSRNIEKALEHLGGVDRVDSVALNDPELQIDFDPSALQALEISPAQLADTITAYFEDIAAGSIQLGGQNWVVRLVGSQRDPKALAARPVIGAKGEVSLGEVARVHRGREKASQIAYMDGKPAVIFAIMKQDNASTTKLVERVHSYIEERNRLSNATGVKLTLVDDQTIPTREAISRMQTNALIGLALVLFVTWVFLGSRIALLTAIGIPFILAGTFWVLSSLGETLNVTVLLGVVIVLGMLVDDAVVIVESIYYRIRQGVDAMTAAIESLREVAKPVTTAVLTTIAAFMPLMLLPGILGDFMRVIPMVVTIALLLSLVEAFWMLPAHVIAANVNFNNPSRFHLVRVRLTHWVQIRYVRLLVKALRHPLISLLLVVTMFCGAIWALSTEKVKVDFFAADTMRIFYVNLEMPSETPLQHTMDKVLAVEAKIRKHLKHGEVRAMVAYAGQMFTEMEPRLGDQWGQILLGLNPRGDLRSVDEMIESMREDVTRTAGPVNISFLRMTGGPPTSKPISIKVRGDSYRDIQAAAETLKDILRSIPAVTDIEDDAGRGRMELGLELDQDAVNRSGLNPMDIKRNLRLLVDGDIVANMRDQGEKLEVRVRTTPGKWKTLGELLDYRMPLADGGSIALSELVEDTRQSGLGNVRHYNFRRAITIEADLLPDSIDTVTANQLIMDEWQKQQAAFPDIDLDFSGELDDIQESMDAIGVLFIFGVGLMYLLLGTQFGSYWQPFMILSTILMAFTGVVAGLLITKNPLSLYTLYGIVALAGIAVNAAIVLISAANARLKAGMSLLHATLYASRRRVIPILITSLTTIAGLFSLATGLGGYSLIWGPVATAIVWGLMFSTLLTLFVVPLLYRTFMRFH